MCITAPAQMLYFFIVSPAHSHATAVAVYLALFLPTSTCLSVCHLHIALSGNRLLIKLQSSCTLLRDLSIFVMKLLKVKTFSYSIQQTGWMSNRGRQNVASFLVKDLGLDWRLGAEWFESLLLDHDVCSNYGNWNYAAGMSICMLT